MASVRQTLKNIFVWSYDRGTLPYDIICALILAFIFFVPRSCFVPKRTEGPAPSIQKAQAVSQTDSSSDESKKK
jgi:hypothetical protein